VSLGSQEFLELETARRGKTRLQYTARASDTLAKIAKRYGLAPGDLARVNRLSATSELAEGQKIVVYSPTPELPREITAARTVPGKPTGKTTLAKPSQTASKSTLARGPVKPANGSRPVAAAKPGNVKSPSKPAVKATPAPPAASAGKKPANGKR
jgi:hypothetical protein